MESSCFASLDQLSHRNKIPLSAVLITLASKLVTVHHFEETINGRCYAIEVTPTQGDRWRAYLVRASGGPTALMPFYGGTPQEAAAGLVTWLSLAHHITVDSV